MTTIGDKDNFPSYYMIIYLRKEIAMRKKRFNETLILKALDWAYERALTSSPFPGVENAISLAHHYLKHAEPLPKQVDSLIRWQNTKAATIGFVTGIGGAPALPLMIPSNIASILFIQIRMVTAIALMGGHDLKDDKVKTMIFACMCGSSTMDLLKSFSIALGKQALLKLNKELIKKVNTAVGLRLLARTGESGVISFTKAIPLIGGAIGGTFDAVTTNIIGKVAKKVFIQ